MAFSVSVVDRMSFGNLKAKIFKLTNVQSTGSTFNSGLVRTRFVRAINQTDNADTFKESFSGNTVTVTSVTDDDDGYIMVVGE